MYFCYCIWRYVIFPYVIIPNVTIPRVVKIPNKYANPERNNPETFYVKIPNSDFSGKKYRLSPH